MPRSAALLLAAAAMTAGLAGCGNSDEQEVRDTLGVFGQATARHDYQTLCDRVFATDLVHRVESIGLPCEEAMRIAMASLHKPTLSVRSVKVTGVNAYASVRTAALGQKPSTDTIQLHKDHGVWRVSSLAGTPVPKPTL
jgi:hypothetical protein